jgi:protein-tyrosine-phosphatase
MAEALFKALLLKKGYDLRLWKVSSAGTWADNGSPVVTETQSVLAARGLDTSQHRSREVKPSMLSKHNLVLTMESGHKEALATEFPQFASRLYMLSEMSGLKLSVADPISGPIQEFENTASEIEKLLEDGFDKIVSLA